MKKHYKGLTVLLSACMLAGSASVAYAGPADDIANGTVGMPNTGSSTSAEQFNQGTGQQDENTALHVGVNYLYNAEGDISAFAMDLKNFEGIGGVSYRAYTNTGGYLWWYHDGIQTGVVGSGSWVEAIQIQLSGQAEKMYDVYYSVTSSGQGKMGYAKNGEVAGTVDIGEKILSIEVVLVPKGSAGPQSAAPRYKSAASGRLSVAENATVMFNEDGSVYNGWLSDDFVRYYFENGYAKTGWQYIDGYKFYFDSCGRLVQDVDSLIGKQSDYLLKVNKTLNCLTVYAKDGNNGYIIPVKAMLTSVGDDTPIGTFKTPEKYRWRLMVNDTYTQYATRITQGFLFHSITYATPNGNNLLTVGYNGLGVSRSLGCVRLNCRNSKWVYDNCHLGTTVQVYEDANVASPFDKPELVPISDQQTWDPTDPKFN
ncbi:L,D-transpeptidase [Clostridium sp. TF06-15AC]|uniref:L,D-transpeptidase family protein n=1 Tax=Clostridium sp. TF06-15AC TaxID=2293051 RepID=UPI000E4A36F5|nr:L,D-transpeptidase family protein [Clostridium sp. TF06-15AC]RHU76042.1 L,D-transpeptidase [Clostridium sp. TF06-15AC]